MREQATPESRKMIAVAGHRGVWRRGNRYVVKYTHRGKVRKKYLRTLTEVKKFKATIAAGDAAPTSAQSFKSYATDWLRTYKGRSARGISDETRESYTHALTAHAIPFFGTTRLDRIDPPMLRDYIAHLESKGLSAATIRRYYAPVRALLATAHEDNLIATRPNVRVVVRTPRRAKRRHLTADETQRLLAAIPAEHADLVLLLARTGARISEVLNATYGGIGQDVDGGPMLSFPKSKTEAGLQPIPLTPDAARMLTRRRAAAGATGDDLIFPNAVGNPYDRRAWTRRVFKPAAKGAGVAWASPHMLRHGVATLMAEQGYEAHDIARMLRHADGGALAQRTYMHPRVRSVDFLDDVMGHQMGHHAP
jgi:integrase